MSLLRTIESRIAHLVEGTFGKVFRTSVQPVELARRLVKEMDEHQQRAVRNTYVPNRFDVYLSRDDHRQLSEFSAALTSELSEYLAEHARRNGFALLTRPRVHLHLDRELGLGRFGIAVRMEQPKVTDDEQTNDPRAALPADAPADSEPSATAVYDAHELAAAQQSAPIQRSEMAVFGPDGPFPLAQARVRVGRGKSNELVLNDASVSREHAELVLPKHSSQWRVRDLNSTNGVAVNGVPVTDQELEPGDVVSFGSCDVRFDHWAAND